MDGETNIRSVELTFLANSCGWVYFSAWTISFYPQLVANYRAKSTEGLSYAFALMNLIGFIALAVYNVYRYIVQAKWKLLTAVEIQDVCFALHAVVLCLVCCGQVLYYDTSRIRDRVSRKTWIAASTLLAIGFLHIVMVAQHIIPATEQPHMRRESFLFPKWSLTKYCALVKLSITLIKYLPQILLNFQRQMTNGLAIWTFNLDVIGGVFSLIQNAIEAINYRTLEFITGNIPKIGIALVGLTYNAIILGQHYFLYSQSHLSEEVLAKDLEFKILFI